jgi:hypothetical protein
MRAGTAIARTSHRVRLTAVGWGLTTVLACVALSACTSGSASTPPASTYIPSASGSATGSATGSVGGSAGTSSTPTGTASGSTSPRTGTSSSASATTSATRSASASASPSASRRTSPQPSSSPSPSPAPDGAPVTGGGATAGFQDAGLAVLGGAAIVAGLGSIAYRRRITRNR